MRLIEIWGTLSFTGGAGQAWLSQDVAIGAHADWPAALTGDAPCGTVREVLDQHGHEDPDGTYLRITPGFPWKIGGIVREEWFRDTGRALVALFCSAAAAGAKGEVSFASDDDDVRFRVKVEGGASKVSVPNEKGVRRAADEKARAALAATLVRPAASSSGLDVASLQRAVVDALETVPEATLREAIQLHAPNHMTHWRLSSKPRIIESMRAGWHLGFLLLYLAHANPAAAEPLALQALAADDMEVRQRALSALGLVGNAAAVDRLLTELTAPIPSAGYEKSANLGANWGLRHVRDPGLRAVIAKAAQEYASRNERHPDVESMFSGIVAHHAKTPLARRRGAGSPFWSPRTQSTTMGEHPFLCFGLLPDLPSPASDGHGYAVRFAKKPTKAARKTIATALVAAARPLLGDDAEIPWRWDGAWLVAWLMDAPGTEDVASEARCATLSSMAAAFTALHEVAPILEVIYLASGGKGTSPWDAWSWKNGAPSPEGLALLHDGGEVDPAVEKARAGAAATRGGASSAKKAATGGTGCPGASSGQLAPTPSQPFSVVALDAKQAPKAPKLVPALKTLVDTLEAARAYGKERIVRVVDAPRGQILWHLDGGWHRLTLADAAGTAIVGSVQTRRVDPNAWERGSIAVSADGSRFLYTDRVTVHEVDVATATSRVVWREERDDLEPGPREAAYVGDAIVVSTLDALWLLEKQPNGEHAPVAVAPLQGFSHMTATPDGRSVLVCTFACEDEPPALRVFHVTGHALRPGATLKEQASELMVVNGRVFAKAARKPVEVVGIPAFEETPSAPIEGPVRLVPAAAPKVGPKAVDGQRVVAATALPGGGWLAAIEASEGHQVVILDAPGGTARTLELPPGFHAGLAVSPDGTRAIVSARRRIDRSKNPGSLLVDLTTGSHEPFGGTTVHAFVSNEVVLAGVALMDVATRAVLATVELPGHRAKARVIAVDGSRTRALIQTSHGDGVVVAVSPTAVRVLGVTPLRPAVVSTSGDGALCILADGTYHRVEAE